MIWVTILPFTLWDQCRWLTTPVAAVIAFLLLGIEEIGVSIEEPMSILALGSVPQPVSLRGQDACCLPRPLNRGVLPWQERLALRIGGMFMGVYSAPDRGQSCSVCGATAMPHLMPWSSMLALHFPSPWALQVHHGLSTAHDRQTRLSG